MVKITERPKKYSFFSAKSGSEGGFSGGTQYISNNFTSFFQIDENTFLSPKTFTTFFFLLDHIMKTEHEGLFCHEFG